MDILDLFMPTLSGVNDEYGKDVDPPLPLYIDRVMENRAFKSTAPLLQLTSDVLAIILSFVDWDSLGNLALVNSDCRQLARSRQFANVCLDFSDATLNLIILLLKEGTLRDRSNNVLGSIGGAIGPCIRRLTVATNPGWISHRHDVELSEEFNALEKSVRDERLARASDAYLKYLRAIEAILSSRATIPHLELLDWEDRVQLPQSFFNSLTTSTIQHLKLSRVLANQDFEITQPPVYDRWNLRTLNMDILVDLALLRNGGHFEDLAASQLCTSLLQSCSHSLETLVWCQAIPEKYTIGFNPAKVPRFAKLRNLALKFVKFGDSGTVDALLEPPLRVLDLTYCWDGLVQEALRNRGQIPSLETLLFILSKSSTDSHLEFLKANTQVSKLTIWGQLNDKGAEELHGSTPEESILSIVSSSFKAIKSLRISWNDGVTMIPDVALAMISRMETLEQVCIGAGCRFGWKHDWLIDHKSMRNHLSVLPRLKKIAFTRDSYKCQTGDAGHELYYSERFPSREDMNAFELDSRINEEVLIQAWEAGHKRRMVFEAEKYLASMPKLEWMYLGQYPMAVIKGASKEERSQVVPLCDERDDCCTLLNRMFGWEGLVSD